MRRYHGVGSSVRPGSEWRGQHQRSFPFWTAHGAFTYPIGWGRICDRPIEWLVCMLPPRADSESIRRPGCAVAWWQWSTKLPRIRRAIFRPGQDIGRAIFRPHVHLPAKISEDVAISRQRVLRRRSSSTRTCSRTFQTRRVQAGERGVRGDGPSRCAKI